MDISQHITKNSPLETSILWYCAKFLFRISAEAIIAAKKVVFAAKMQSAQLCAPGGGGRGEGKGVRKEKGKREGEREGGRKKDGKRERERWNTMRGWD